MSLDMQIKSLMSELSTQLPDVNLDQILIDILNNESKSFNEANDIITNLDALTEVKDELGKGLQDLAALAKLREKYIQEYQNIQENPDKFREEPMDKAQKDIEDGIDTFVVKQTNILPNTIFLYFFSYKNFIDYFNKNGYILVSSKENKTTQINYKNFRPLLKKIKYLDLFFKKK